MFLPRERVETYKKEIRVCICIRHNAYKKQSAYSICTKRMSISGEKFYRGSLLADCPYGVISYFSLWKTGFLSSNVQT